MGRREKIAVAILVLLFALFGLFLWKPYRGAVHKPKDSVFVRQRMINLEKSNK